VAGGADPVCNREEQIRLVSRSLRERDTQFGPEPQEPHAPPQQPPPLCSVPKSTAEEGSPPATAKLETSTLVLVDSQAGQI
jgi:hypothetical protein